jgi:beta-mannosidase
VTGARKLGWYTSAAIMAPRAIVATAPTSLIGVTIVNDVPQPWQATAHVRAVAESGEILCDEHSDIDIAADASHVLVPSHVPADAVAVVVDVDGIRAVRWLVPDRELRHPAARVTVESVVYHPPTGSTSIAVRATDLIRDLALLAETHPGLEAARVDRQLLTLLPGESATFAVTGQGVDALSDKDWAGLLVAGTALVVQ